MKSNSFDLFLSFLLLIFCLFNLNTDRILTIQESALNCNQGFNVTLFSA